MTHCRLLTAWKTLKNKKKEPIPDKTCGGVPCRLNAFKSAIQKNEDRCTALLTKIVCRWETEVRQRRFFSALKEERKFFFGGARNPTQPFVLVWEWRP